MYRVTIQGRFTSLTAAQRAEVLARSDVMVMSFTRTGTFTCDRNAGVFTFRCEVPPADEDHDSAAAATQAALHALRQHDYPHQVRRSTVTDLRDVKVRRS